MNEPTIAEQKAFYDSRWQQLEHANNLKRARAAAILSALAETDLKLPRILDLGCGTGWLSNILSMFGTTTGVELSGHAVAEAGRRFPHVTFVEGNFLEWNRGEQFEVIVAQEVIEHFLDHEAFMARVASLLSPGGYLILTTDNPQTQAEIPDYDQNWGKQPIENQTSLGGLKRLSKRHGLDVVRATTIVPGYGSLSLKYRVLNSRRIQGLVGRRFLRQLACRMGCGLHLLLVARKPL